jgi:hypothetical protein
MQKLIDVKDMSIKSLNSQIVVGQFSTSTHAHAPGEAAKLKKELLNVEARLQREQKINNGLQKTISAKEQKFAELWREKTFYEIEAKKYMPGVSPKGSARSSNGAIKSASPIRKSLQTNETDLISEAKKKADEKEKEKETICVFCCL